MIKHVLIPVPKTSTVTPLMVIALIIIVLNFPYIVFLVLTSSNVDLTESLGSTLGSIVELYSYMLLLPMGLAALSSIFGIVACIVGIKSWRTSSNPSKAWLIVVAVVSVVLGFATAWPFVQNQLSLNNYAKTSIEEKVSSYVSYETARDEIMSCKIDYVTVLALGISNGKDGYYMVLGTRWDYDTYGTRYGSTTDQYGDAIRLYLAYEYKDAIKKDIEVSNSTCSSPTTFNGYRLRYDDVPTEP